MEQQNIESGNCISVSLSLPFPQRRIPYTNRKKTKVVFFLSFLFSLKKKNYILKTRSIDYCYVKNEVHISLSPSIPCEKKTQTKDKNRHMGSVCVERADRTFLIEPTLCYSSSIFFSLFCLLYVSGFFFGEKNPVS